MGDAGLPPLEPLPTPHLSSIGTGISLLEPLSRRGHGPGLIILTPGDESPESSLVIKNYVPSPLIKWAEEGFTVVTVQSKALESTEKPLQLAVDALKASDKCDQGKIGLVAYDVSIWNAVESSVKSTPEIAGVVVYTDGDTGLLSCSVPCVQHVAGKSQSKLPRTSALTGYEYPTAESQSFAIPAASSFNYALEAVSHTRNLTFFKRHDIIGGPIFDLEEIWDEHTYFEFENRSVPHTMATMVEEPYVNHVPTLTGGIGRKRLTEFYSNHFHFSNPADSELELISRTVGIDRVVDEFIFKCTHDKTIDWLVPSLPPTGKQLQIPMTAIVNIRGDRLYHEHINWDQGTVLRQIGVLPEYLPWNYPVPDPSFVSKNQVTNGEAKSQLEARIPVGGNETASKMRNKNSVESNAMFDYKMRYL